MARGSHLWVVVSARTSNGEGISWVAEWLENRMHWPSGIYNYRSGIFGVLIPLSIATVALFGVVVVEPTRRFTLWARNKGWWLIPMCALAAVFWFFLAPAPRFGFAVMWSLGAACG